MQLYDYDIKKLQSSMNTPWKFILLIYFTFLVKALSPSFHYILGKYISCFTFYWVKIDGRINSSTKFTRKNGLFPLLGMYLLYNIFYLLWTLARIWCILDFQISCSNFVYIATEKAAAEASAAKIDLKVSALSLSWPLFTAFLLCATSFITNLAHVWPIFT